MDELPIFPDGAIQVVPTVVDDVVHEAFGINVVDLQQPDIVVRKEMLGTLVNMGSGEGPTLRMGRFGPSLVNLVGFGIGLVSYLGKSADAMDEVRVFYTNQRFRLKDFDSELSLIFQGGAVKEDRMAISTMSLGTVFDFSVPRGFMASYDGKKIVSEILPVIGDHESTPLENPFSEILEYELRIDESILLSTMKELPAVGKFRTTKGSTYAAGYGVFLIVIPFMGKTIVSVMTTAFGNNPESRSRTFPMRVLGKDKPLDFEVSVPSIDNLRNITTILARFRNLPDYLKTDVEPMPYELGIGASVYLAFDIARREFIPERGPFSMWEFIEQGPFVKKTIESIKSHCPDMSIDIRSSFPRILIHK
ncbi:MAG: hypothetical protein ACW98Y_10655 [Candidatus Thorarchaeota archaeon]|jgi:hypothetical protein